MFLPVVTNLFTQNLNREESVPLGNFDKVLGFIGKTYPDHHSRRFFILSPLVKLPHENGCLVCIFEFARKEICAKHCLSMALNSTDNSVFHWLLFILYLCYLMIWVEFIHLPFHFRFDSFSSQGLILRLLSLNFFRLLCHFRSFSFSYQGLLFFKFTFSIFCWFWVLSLLLAAERRWLISDWCLWFVEFHLTKAKRW